MPAGNSRAPRRRTHTLRRGAAVAACAAALSLTGCTESTTTKAQEQDVEVTRHGSGPLSATLEVGGNAIYAPGVSPWHVSFGHFVLCSRTPGIDIELEDVSLADTPVEPLGVKVLVRSVKPSDFPKSGRVPTELQPFYSARGGAPDFTEPYADPAPAGRFSGEVAGTRITQTCEETKERMWGYKELVFSFTVGDEGSRVDAFTIDYRAEGTAYRLRVPWNMVACGSRIVEPGLCR